MYIGASLILFLIILQGIQIYLYPDIKDRALWVSIVALMGYIAGGIIDNLNIVNLSQETDSIIRLVFTLIVVFANAIIRQYNTVDNQMKLNIK